MTTLPQHIAIVMDGNGRWAKNRHLPHLAGHRAGLTAARNSVKYCAQRHIPVLSLFAFSTENWKRSSLEVNHLMGLFLSALTDEIGMLNENRIRLRFIGNRTRFKKKLLDKMIEVETSTAQNTGMTLIIAVDYGGQWDILEACRRLAVEIEAGRLTSHSLTVEHISSQLSFADLPNPDLFIRTSDEARISNFMLWQLAYAELYFTDTLWPDFDEQAFDKAILYFSARERRYGGRK